MKTSQSRPPQPVSICHKCRQETDYWESVYIETSANQSGTMKVRICKTCLDFKPRYQTYRITWP